MVSIIFNGASIITNSLLSDTVNFDDDEVFTFDGNDWVDRDRQNLIGADVEPHFTEDIYDTTWPVRWSPVVKKRRWRKSQITYNFRIFLTILHFK